MEKEKFSTNELAEKIVGKRVIEKGTIIFDAPFELGYHCPKCKYKQSDDGEWDERLEWSEYNGFIWCRECNVDYPSVMCQPDHEKAIKTYLECVLDAKSLNKKEVYNKSICDVLQVVEGYENGEQNTRVIKNIMNLKK